jgi:peroxiredoxin
MLQRPVGVATVGFWLWLGAVAVLISGSATAQAGGFAEVADLPLPAAGGQPQSLAADAEARFRVVCFLGTECPLAKLYGPRLAALAREYADQGVAFVGINANPQDSLEEIWAAADRAGIGFPLLKDARQQVALALGATRTPEVIVVDAVGRIRYRGRIDDQYAPGVARPEPTAHHLRDALRQLTAGEEVAITSTEPVGCLIQLPAESKQAATEVTFAREVSRILERNCVECHRAGEIGPFVLDDYDEVVGWGDMLLEVIDQGRMPPWHASEAGLPLANARRMPAEDIAALRAWVKGGMPLGDPAELPESVARVGGWDLSVAPDAVFPMAAEPFAVPAEGVVEYQYFVVDPGFTEDVWVKEVAVEPGNRSVVHHAIVFLRPPDGGEQSGFGLLCGYVPGQRRLELPAGHAQRIQAGTRLVFQMHYTPTGRPEADLTRVGLVFADAAEVTHEVFTIGGVEQEFEIPPGASDYSVEGALGRMPATGSLLAVTPHMHLRGRSFRLEADRSGDRELLVDVPHYDFNWQHNYALSDPLPLARVDRLGFVMTYDNSFANPFNPDPTEHVTWGDQTWEEMAVVFATVARPLAAADDQSAEDAGLEAEAKARREAEIARQSEAFADDYLQKLDRDGDGAIARDEAPDAVRMFAFGRLDLDDDGVIRRDELVHRASERFRRR